MLKKYIGLIVEKVKCLRGNVALSSIVLQSRVDRTAVLRPGVRFYSSSIGRYSYIARDSLIQNTEIGSFCSISEGCMIGLPAHPLDMISTSPVFLKGDNYLKRNLAFFEFEDSPKTYIGNDVWVGAHAMVKSGVRIGNGAVIAAGAVVTRDVDDYAIVGGIPAQLIRYRFDQEERAMLNNSAWWNWTEKAIADKADTFYDVEQFKKHI